MGKGKKIWEERVKNQESRARSQDFKKMKKDLFFVFTLGS